MAPVVHRWAARGTERGVVVLQHGYGEHAQRWASEHGGLVDVLRWRGWRVLAPDLAGHGSASGERGVCDVGAAVTAHRSVRGEAIATGLPAVLVGHSLGGLITAGSLVADPTGVAGVVLLSPALPPALPAPVRAAVRGLARVAPARELPWGREPLDGLAADPAVIARTADDPQMHHGQVGLLVASSALDVVADVWAGAARWDTPTLVCHGSADRYTDPAASARLVRRIGPAATLHEVAGGRHELLHDSAGDRTRAVVLDWLTAQMH